MNWWELYLLTRLDVVRDMAIAGLVAAFIAFALGLLFFPDIADSHAERTFLRKTAKRLAWFAAACTFAAAVAPSQKDLAIIIAGHWASNSEEMKKLPDNVAKTLNSLLDMANAKLSED